MGNIENASSDYQHIRVKAFAPNLGTTIRGVDIYRGVSDAEFAEINRALLKHQVWFFQRTNRGPSIRACGFWQKIWALAFSCCRTNVDGHPEIFEIHADKNSKVANGEH